MKSQSIKDDLVFTPTQSTPEYENLDLTSTLSPSFQYAVRQLIHRELDVLTESDWFIEFIDERIIQAFEINAEQED